MTYFQIYYLVAQWEYYSLQSMYKQQNYGLAVYCTDQDHIQLGMICTLCVHIHTHAYVLAQGYAYGTNCHVCGKCIKLVTNFTSSCKQMSINSLFWDLFYLKIHHYVSAGRTTQMTAHALCRILNGKSVYNQCFTTWSKIKQQQIFTLDIHIFILDNHIFIRRKKTFNT